MERPHKGFKGLINYASNTPRANVIVHRNVAEDAKRMNIFLSSDLGGIGSAFHRAEGGRKEKTLLSKLTGY